MCDFCVYQFSWHVVHLLSKKRSFYLEASFFSFIACNLLAVKRAKRLARLTANKLQAIKEKNEASK